VRVSVRACAIAAAFLEIEQAAPVQEAEGEPPPRHPYDLADRAALVRNEAKRRNGYGDFEAAIAKRESLGLSGGECLPRGGTRLREAKPVGIGIEARDGSVPGRQRAA
jgi:hypothetical protein